MKKVFDGSYAYKTDVGRVRVSNEDQAFVSLNAAGEVFLIVCDGMGGQNKGDFASKMALDSLLDSFKNKSDHMPSFLYKHWIGRAIKKANLIIYNEAQNNNVYNDMGTTLICALIFGNKIMVANVGDSRAYALKDGKLIHLSEDQSYVDYLYRTGKISQEETKSHPDRHMLMNALGIFPSSSYDVNIRPYNGETVLLCSDGLYNNVSEPEIRAIMSSDDRADQKVMSFISEANCNGGSDNIAVSYWESLNRD